jgi:hypothetical protein
MASLIMCPGCGRYAEVEPGPDGRVACGGCGKSLTRLVLAELYAAATPVEPGSPVDPPTDDLTAAVTAATASPTAPPRPARRLAPAWAGPAIAIGAAVLAGGGILTGYALRSPAAAPTQEQSEQAWEDQNRGEIAQLKAGVDSAVRAGDLAGGRARYARLMQLVGQRDVVDPALRDQLQSAKTYGLLLAQADPTAPPPNVPAVAVASAVPTSANEATAVPAAATASTAAPQPQRTSSLPVTIVNPPVHRPLPPAVPMAVALPGRAADQRIGDSLGKGVDYLIGQFRNGQLNDGQASTSVYHQGLDALCVYALLHAGDGSHDPRLDPHAPFMTGLMATLKAFPMESDGTRRAPVVYARSLRAAALAVFNRPEDKTALRADVAWLVHAATRGSYTYDDSYANGRQPAEPPFDGQSSTGAGGGTRLAADNDPRNGPGDDDDRRRRGDRGGGPGGFRRGSRDGPDRTGPGRDGPGGSLSGAAIWDNSNSQYGLLGVWAGAEAGVEVPQAYWKAVESHWVTYQTRDGQWYYTERMVVPRYSMTCAGVASLLVTHEWLDAPALGSRVGRPPYSAPLTAGLGWLESGDNVMGVDGRDTLFMGYSAYGLERCALASGFKFFGTHDWFKELSDELIPQQSPNGTWGGSVRMVGAGGGNTVNTAYMVLFLSRGRHPVLMNKLRMDPYWDNRPRDLANLTTFASTQLERPFNWQVVSFARPWHDWMDAPILYVASHVPPKLTPDDEAKLKAYAEAGGLIFTHADSASPSFTQWANDLAKRLWPNSGGLQPLPKDHELYSVVFHLKDRPLLSAVSNGSRLLMVHSPTDLSPTWQEQPFKGGRETYGLGVNLFVWAAGKSNFRNRLDTPYLPEPPSVATPAVSVARLRYPGAWDPEPYAWTHFARYFQWTTSIPVAATTVDLAALQPGQTPVAVLTGTTAITFSDADVAAVRAYVTAGGTLLVDACGGSPAFAASAESLLAQAFPTTPLAPLSDDDPLIRGGPPGIDDLTHPTVRSYTTEKLNLPVGGKPPALGGLVAGAGHVVYTPLDLTTGLLDTNSWGILGYTPTYAQAAVKNVLLTAGNR